MTSSLTLDRLVSAGACKDQVARFRELFGEEVVVTEQLCVEHAAVFDWGWAAKYLLPVPARVEWEKAEAVAFAEYEKAVADARAEYDKPAAVAWAVREKAVAGAQAGYGKAEAVVDAWVEWEKAEAVALTEYWKAEAVALAEYKKAKAGTWARAYLRNRDES